MAKNKAKITIKGNDKILHDIEQMGDQAPQIIKKALRRVGDEATAEFKNTIEDHRYSGITEDTLIDPEMEEDIKKISISTGFDIDAGGLAAIYLDKGKPNQSPINYVKRIKGKASIKREFKKALDEITKQ